MAPKCLKNGKCDCNIYFFWRSWKWWHFGTFQMCPTNENVRYIIQEMQCMENKVTLESDNRDEWNFGLGSGNIYEKRYNHHQSLVKHFIEVIGWYQKSKLVVLEFIQWIRRGYWRRCTPHSTRSNDFLNLDAGQWIVDTVAFHCIHGGWNRLLC